MNLYFDLSLAEGYRNKTQIVRRLTEGWLAQNMYCPFCGNENILQYENNRPVADFYCPNCYNEYELKSKNGNISKTVNDGAYHTMITRITANNNPHFFFLGYNKHKQVVNDLILIPKHFFVPDIIEKRNPLANHTRRAGWIGCNINLSKIPLQGRVYIIHNGLQSTQEHVLETFSRCQALKISNINARGWLMDILNCINEIPSAEFALDQIYSFERTLAYKHPYNHNIKHKIRQQLQILRDKGFLEFLGKGHYRKIGRHLQ